MNPPEQFETPRLVIRRARPADAGAVFARWTQDAGVAKFLTWRPHQTPADSEAFPLEPSLRICLWPVTHFQGRYE